MVTEVINGIINVYKEKGFTSHDVVAKLRGILKQKKIGHTGTLDPDATGVLPVCLGSGTKLCDMLTEKNKEYVAELLLGITTDTQDTSGTIIQEREVNVSKQQAEEAILSFLGKYMQIPPMYSALKIDGKKLYQLARQGIEVERKARPVIITSITIMEMNLPVIKIKVGCSKGTYIRTLCYDIGEKLGCGATMKSLIRTNVSQFHIENALTLTQIEELQKKNELSQFIISVESMFQHLKAYEVKKEFRKFIDNGNSLFFSQLQEMNQGDMNCEHMNCDVVNRDIKNQDVCIYNDEGRFCGIYHYDNEKKYLKPVKMFGI